MFGGWWVVVATNFNVKARVQGLRPFALRAIPCLTLIWASQKLTKRTATEMWSHAAAAGYRNISFRTLPPTQVIYIFTSTTFIVHWKQENEENILWRFINNIGLVKELLRATLNILQNHEETIVSIGLLFQLKIHKTMCFTSLFQSF